MTNEETIKLLTMYIKPSERPGPKDRTTNELTIIKFIPFEAVLQRFNEVWGLDWQPELMREIVHAGEVSVVLRVHYPTESGMRYRDAYGGAKIEVGLGNAFKKSASLALVKIAQSFGIDIPDTDVIAITEQQVREIIKLMKATNNEPTEEHFSEFSKMDNTTAEALISALKKQLAN